MGYLLITFLFIAHLSLIKAFGLLLKEMGVSITFKRLIITAPINIILSIVFIYISELSWSDAGFIIGDPSSGLIYILILGVPITLFFMITFLRMSEDELENIISVGEDNPKIQLFYVWVMVGPVEEFLYRGFLQANLNRFVSGGFLTIAYSTIIASLIFTFVHLVNVIAEEESIQQFITQFPVRFLMAMILGYTFQVTGSLIYPIIIHNLFDGSNFSVLMYRRKAK